MFGQHGVWQSTPEVAERRGTKHSLTELFRGLNAWEGEAGNLASGSFVSLCVELHQRLAAFT